MRLASTVMFVAFVGVPTVVWADDDVTPPDRKLSIGAELALLPIGTLRQNDTGFNDSAPTLNAYAVGGMLDYQLTPLVSIGFAPRFVFAIRPEDSTTSAEQLDLRARATIGTEIAPFTRFYGVGTAGYAIMILPSDTSGPASYPRGFVLGLGAGLSYAIGPRIQILGEASYQRSYLNTTVEGVDVSIGDNYVTFSGAILFAID